MLDLTVPSEFGTQSEFEALLDGQAGVDGEQTPEELKLTSAAEWREFAREGALYKLPGSGRVMRLRKPSLMAMSVKAGYVPNPLQNEVLRFMAEVDQSNSYARDPQSEAKQVEHYKKRVAAFLHIVVLAAVEPEVVLDGKADYGAGQINITDIPDRDIMWIVFSLVEGEALPIDAPFRKS